MFEIQTLESLEINPSKKIFKINGEDFGKHCHRYDIEIYHEHDEVVISFHRHGTTVFKNTFDADTGKIKSHFQKESNL